MCEEIMKELKKETIFPFIYEFNNGFVGVGRLKNPESHHKGKNTIVIRTCNTETDEAKRFAITDAEAFCMVAGLASLFIPKK